MNDSTLLRQYIDHRSQSAFAELVDRHGPMVHATARRIAGEEADDIAQAVFLLLAQRSARLAGHANLAGWLYRTTRYCAANARRARDRRIDAAIAASKNPMPNYPSSVMPEQQALLDHLDREMASLPARYRQVLLLRYLSNLSVEQTAERMGLSAAAVMKRSTRGLARLREKFARRGLAVSTELIAGCMVGQAGGLSAAQRSAMSAVGGGSAAAAPARALASTTLRTMAAAHAKAIAMAMACTAVGAVVAVQTVRQVSDRPAAPPPNAQVILADLAIAPAAAIVPNTAENPDDAAQQFLAAIVTGDREQVARYLPPGDDAAARAKAQHDIDLFGKELYARFPQRLTEIATSMTGNDASGKPDFGSYQTATPFDAQSGHAAIRVSRQGGHWFVVSATFVNRDAAFASTLPDLAAVPARDRKANWIKAEQDLRTIKSVLATNAQQTKSADLPGLSTKIDQGVHDLHDLAEVMHGTTREMTDANVQVLADSMSQLAQAIGDHGLTGLRSAMSARQKNMAVMAAQGALYSSQFTIMRNAAAQTEADHTAKRPSCVGPDRQVSAAGKPPVSYPGPLEIPSWLWTTPGYKQWLLANGIRLLITRDDAGNIYTLVASTPLRNADGTTPAFTADLHMFRPDKSLAAETEWNNTAEPTAWRTMDPAGKQMQWQVDTTTDKKHRVHLDRIIHFDASGNEHIYEIGLANTIEQEVLTAAPGNAKPENEPLPFDGGL